MRRRDMERHWHARRDSNARPSPFSGKSTTAPAEVREKGITRFGFATLKSGSECLDRSLASAHLLKIKIKPDAIRLSHDSDHYRDFISCVRTRKTPVSNIDSAAQSDFMSHLGDIAIRTGRTIRWDPATETSIGDEAAARMTRRAPRAPWSL